jgi:glucosamine--fructose-6-phosphate aminotransferase (isomerizing)
MAIDLTPAPRWINGIEPSKELLACNGTQILEIECREQSARLRELLHAYCHNPALQKQLAAFRKLAAAPGPVLFIGMGGSFCSSISASIHLQSHGRSSFSLDAGEWLNYAAPLWQRGGDAALSILLTTSGESAELVELFKRGNRPQGLICNNPASTCWGLTDHKLPILAGPEYGNATKTYTNATAAAIILASEMLSQPWQQNAHRAVDIFSNSLDPIFAQRAELEQFCHGAANTELIGRGAAQGAANKGARTLREMSGHRAAPHTGAAFRHGPNLDIDHTHLALIFALGHTAPLGIKLAQECNRKGGKVVLISSENHERTNTLYPIHIAPVPEPWEGLTSILVPQALTLAMIERHGCRLPPRFQYGKMEQ